MKVNIDLVKRAIGGDIDSYWQLAEEYYEEIFRFCRKKLFYKDHKAEDATHDSFIKMMDRVMKLQDSTKFKSYLYRIAYTNCVDRLKYCNRFINPIEEDIDFISSIESKDPNPEEVAIELNDNNRLQILISSMEHLTEEQKKIIRLAHFENRSYKEVAKIMKIPVGTVRSRLSRTVAKLTSIIKDKQ